jgi:hypothetical protein
MPDRFVPQTIRKATLLGLCKDTISIVRKKQVTGIAIPIIAKALPTVLPVLKLIWTRLTMPKTTADIGTVMKIIKTGTEGSGMVVLVILMRARGSMARGGKVKKLRMPSTNDTMASVLTLTFTPSVAC